MQDRTLIAVGAWALLLGGVGHVLTLGDAWGLWVFAPNDPSAREIMRAAPVALASALGAEVSVWSAYLGFSLSHGLGLAFFGVLHLQLLRREPGFHQRHPWLLTISVAWAAMWLLLSLVFWFYGPLFISSLALACFGTVGVRVADPSRTLPRTPAASANSTRECVPYLAVDDGRRAVTFYSEVFGCRPWVLLDMPDGRVMHCEFRIGDARFFVSDELQEHGGTPSPTVLGRTSVAIHLYVADCDALMRRMAAHGAEVLAEPSDMFWGERFGRVRDPFGHEWGVATQLVEMAPAEIERAAKALLGGAGQG